MLHITEYAKLFNGQIPIPVEPSLGSQTLEVGDTSVASKALNPATSIVRCHAEEACVLVFGPDPVAAETGVYLPQGATEYFAVTGGQKVAVIGFKNATGSRDDAFLKAIADAPATMKRAKELAAKTEALNAAKAAAAKATSEAMQAQAVLAVKQHDVETRIAALEAAREQAAKDHAIAEKASADLAARQKAHAYQVKTWTEYEKKTQADLDQHRRDFERGAERWDLEAKRKEMAILAAQKDLDARTATLKAAEDDYEQRMGQLESIGRRKKAS